MELEHLKRMHQFYKRAPTGQYDEDVAYLIDRQIQLQRCDPDPAVAHTVLAWLDRNGVQLWQVIGEY